MDRRSRLRRPEEGCGGRELDSGWLARRHSDTAVGIYYVLNTQDEALAGAAKAMPPESVVAFGGRAVASEHLSI